VIIVIGVVAAIAAPKKTTPTAANTPAASAAVTPSPTPSPTPTLGAGDARFVAAVRGALSAAGFSNSGTDAQIASIGDSICSARQSGGTEAHVSGAITGTESRFSMTPAKLVKTAEKDICPSMVPKPPAVLLSMSGSGIRNSAPFTVNSGTLTVTYSYDCSGAGGTGNFIADLNTPNQGSLSSDTQSIANALGSGGTATTTIYPQNVGSQYYLAVDSECNWSVKVMG
jgi:hypothetical protein